jgi:hypothetical protein
MARCLGCMERPGEVLSGNESEEEVLVACLKEWGGMS